jgi:hypothetical protein
MGAEKLYLFSDGNGNLLHKPGITLQIPRFIDGNIVIMHAHHGG